MNTATVIGRLTNDIELRFTNGGTAVANFRLAVPAGRSKDGTELPPDWVPVTAYGRTAEALAEYNAKGDQIAVTGRLTSHEWDDVDGTKKSRLEITARSIDFLARKRTTNGDPAPEQASDEEPF
jgi:single-strand DNA-binding protein